MAEKKIDFETVREIGFSLPDVEEGTMYGAPCLKARGKMFACTPTHRSAEPHSLVVRIDFEKREVLQSGSPDIYYLKDHYVSYPCVLVRLKRIRRDELSNLSGMAWSFVTAKTRPVMRRRSR